MNSSFTDASTRHVLADVWESVAACSALGLNFWSHGPGPETLWALDDNRRPHLLCVDAVNSEVQAICSWIETAADEHHSSCAFELGRTAYRRADPDVAVLSLFEASTAPQALGA
ncbi:DUF7457 domain-containing protein [Mycolicibacterium aubagnense]|uniref:DUF7457 domain-containing protein n=1 Tax=Mycolicibacterium aubagnense TaxID=319707 RepID=UPI003B8A92EC